MGLEDGRWDRVRRWELEYDRARFQKMSPEEKLGIYDEMYETVKRLCPEKLDLKKISTPDDAYRDPHLADLLAMQVSLIKAYRSKPGDQ